MAWLQTDPSGNFHVSFRFGGTKFKRSLKTKSQREADARVKRLEENIRLVESGRLEISSNTDLPLYLLSDGKLNGKPQSKKSISLAELFDAYFGAIPKDTLEQTTVRGIEIHRRHLERHLGVRFRMLGLRQSDLQRYITQRSKEKGIRGRNLSATTIRKEIATLRAVWNWAVGAHHIMAAAVERGLERRETDNVKHVGVDEKSFGSGHDYVSVLTDIDQSRVLEVARDRTIAACEKLWKTLTKQQLGQIESVSMDMWQAFMSSAAKHVPGAKIVHDKFHIAKYLGEAVDKVIGLCQIAHLLHWMIGVVRVLIGELRPSHALVKP